MNREAYPSDLTDAQWEVLAPLIPLVKPGGRPRTVDLREVINGILYVLRSGCTWRMMPHDLPHGVQPGDTFAGGEKTALGNASMMLCAPKYGRWKGESLRPQQP